MYYSKIYFSVYEITETIKYFTHKNNGLICLCILNCDFISYPNILADIRHIHNYFIVNCIIIFLSPYFITE